jgi:hypothetical protein
VPDPYTVPKYLWLFNPIFVLARAPLRRKSLLLRAHDLTALRCNVEVKVAESQNVEKILKMSKTILKMSKEY